MTARLTRSGPRLAPVRDDGAPGSSGPTRTISRRAALRPEVRAAMALEEAGELQEAARVFEYAGEHAQAAMLRLEYARTLREPSERLDVLREGCARNPGDTTAGRTLHLSLAEALLAEADTLEDAARIRGLHLEAARALEEAGQGAQAGDIYESLALLHKAATAYERAGEVTRLEFVLEVLERQDHDDAARRALISEIDDAVADGRRRYAFELIVGNVRARGGTSMAPHAPLELVTRLQHLETRLVRRDRVDLAWNGGRSTAVRGASRLRIGRAPDAELSVPGVRLSRHHAEIRVSAAAGAPVLELCDLGSRAGTFWNGDALAAGEAVAIDGVGEIGLGTAAALAIHPVRSDAGVIGALLQTHTDTRHWTLFLPEGGPLWLAPEIHVPARLLFDRGFAVLDLRSGVAASLDSHELSPGANLELMVGDTVALRDAPLHLEVQR